MTISAIEHAATLAAQLMLEACEGASATTKARVGAKVVPAHVAAKDALTLIRIGKAAARRAVQACNGIERWDSKARQAIASWTEADEARKERADEKALKAAQVILDRYGATAILGGDPRGYVLRVTFRSNASNSFASEAWGIA